LGAGIAKSNRELSFLISDPSPSAQRSFADRIGESRTEFAASNLKVFQDCSTVFLAVKPQFLATALDGIAVDSTTSPLVVSVMAGVPVSRIAELTGCRRIVRVMPNTPCLIGAGASALASSDSLEPRDIEEVRAFLESVGIVEIVSETLLDVVTGLSGSGPAFVFRFIEALVDGAVANGLSPEMAGRLAVQTVLGAAKMVQETGESTAVLRDRVTSPGGTTLAGLKALETLGFGGVVESAVTAATQRSQEMGEMY
jgi:pyrroline-5-carboxylate reductase